MRQSKKWQNIIEVITITLETIGMQHPKQTLLGLDMAGLAKLNRLTSSDIKYRHAVSHMQTHMFLSKPEEAIFF